MLRTRRPLLALLLLGVLLAAGYLFSALDSDDARSGGAAPTAGVTTAVSGSATTGTAAGGTSSGSRPPTASLTPTAGRTPTAGPTAGRTATTRPAPSDGLDTVRAAELPSEARRVLRLIDAGGPFPYPQDGGVFGNFERLLPAHQRGWYREYTVPTPGERDRGARRIIAGQDGTHYYTADHYDSFARVEP